MDRDIVYQPAMPVNQSLTNGLQQYGQPQNDVEIIDLDAVRDQIKPTTWHK